MSNNIINNIKNIPIRADTYDWDVFINTKSDLVHISRLKRLMLLMYGNNDKFYHSLIDSDEGMEIFKIKMDDINPNSKINITNSLIKILSQCLSNNYILYTCLRDKYKIDIKQLNMIRSVPNIKLMLPKINKLKDNLKISITTRILCLFIIESLKINEQDTGILRISDLIKTRFHDIIGYNYLNIDTKQLIIKPESTKNKTGRILNISKNFIKYLKEMYNQQLPTFLLVDNNGNEFKDSKVISKRFKNETGYIYTIFRSAFISHLETECIKNNDSNLYKQICHNEGHKVSTVLMNYKRKII